MSTVTFKIDNSVQGTITSISTIPIINNVYAYTTNLSSLSSYSYLNISSHTNQLSNLNTTTLTFNNN